jgi:hypothetical protein
MGILRKFSGVVGRARRRVASSSVIIPLRQKAGQPEITGFKGK